LSLMDCDNINIILLIKNSIYHARTKHIHTHYHFGKKKAKNENIIKYPTNKYF
jgi:hypothetical protein